MLGFHFFNSFSQRFMVSAHYVATLTPHSADTCVVVRMQCTGVVACLTRGRCEVGIQPFKLLEVPSIIHLKAARCMIQHGIFIYWPKTSPGRSPAELVSLNKQIDAHMSYLYENWLSIGGLESAFPTTG